MAILVVCGSARAVGKTALACGLIAVLPEFAWTAVKITSHEHEGHGHERRDHERLEPIWEEAAAGQGTDTARFLAAGARRAFLITAKDEELAQALAQFLESLNPGEHVLFESNRVLQHVQPDLSVAIDAGHGVALKASFRVAERQSHALVRLGKKDCVAETPAPGNARPVFQLASFGHISPPMQQWLRARLKG